MFTVPTAPHQPSHPPLNRAQPAPWPRQRGAARYWAPLVLAALVALGMAGCTTLDEQQRRWIFQPSDRTWSGGLAAAQGMQDVWIQFQPGQPEQARTAQTPAAPPAAGPRLAPPPVQLHALWLPQGDAAAPVLLYLHGARWDVRGSAHRMRRMHEMGFSVLGVDYRGFGQSTPALPSEASAVEDALAAWHWLGQQWPQAQRYVFGHSLGGAVAVQMAARVTAAPTEAPTAAPTAARSPLAGLIVEGSFTSIADVFKTLRWGWLPLQPFITQRFDAGQQITRVAAPVLVVHGSEDRLIKPELGRALYDKAPEPKRFLLVQGGSHHNTNAVGQDQVRAALTELFGLPAVALR